MNTNSSFKLGLYENETNLFPFSNININIEIINKFVKFKLVHIYNNPFKEKVNATYFIPKQIVKYFNSLKIEYNNNIYEGIIANKTKKFIKEFVKGDDENKCIDLLEFNKKRKKYFYIKLKDIRPNQQIKIEINFLQELAIEKNKICYIIPNIYIPLNNSDKKYDYKFDINVKNTKLIANIFFNYEKMKFNIKNDNEFNIIYSNIRENDISFIKNFKLTYEIKQNNEPDIIILKHPLYENDYVCHFNINPKYLIEEKGNKDNIINDNINENFEGNIIIYLIPDYKKLPIQKQSIIYLLKSLPQNGYCFNVINNSPIFKECKPINDKNINEAMNMIENFRNKNCIYYTNPEESDEIKNINFIKNDMSKKTRIFIIGEYYDHIDYFIKKLDNFIDNDFRIYTFVLNEYDHQENLYKIKQISDKTNGNITMYDIELLPEKLIEIFQKEMINDNYISNINIKFENNDDNNNNIFYFKNLGKKRIDSNIEFLMSMNKNNKIKLEFLYKDKKYEYLYNIFLDKFETDDMLHKILYYNKYYDFSLIEDVKENKENKNNNKLNKFFFIIIMIKFF